MGLDFVVLSREDDDSPENWPGHEVDARRADDPDPIVQEALRRIYDREFPPAAAAPPPEPPPPEISEGLLAKVSRALFGFPRRKAPPERRGPPPTFEAWRAELTARTPPPVVVPFGPNCPPEGEPNAPAAVQWYGFRGKVLEPEWNGFTRWWSDKNGLELGVVLYGDGNFEDGPRSAIPIESLDMTSPTIADMAALFEQMAADCAAAAPEIAAAADADQFGGDTMGPYPESGFDDRADPSDLSVIRGAARFFRFWEGRGYAIASDY